MEIIREKMVIKNINNIDRVPEGTIFIDIETLGFQAAYQPIYMIGTAEIHASTAGSQSSTAGSQSSTAGRQSSTAGSQSSPADILSKADEIHAPTAEIILYFAESPDEEKEMLSAFLENLGNVTTTLTYNGDMFDLPYIRNRCAKYGLGDPFVGIESIDLCKRVRKMKKLLRLPGCKQTDVEDFLEISREDTMNGGVLIPVYQRYARHPNEDDRGLLVLHNLCDVKGMLQLLSVLSYEKIGLEEPTEVTVTVDPKEGYAYVNALLPTALPKPVRCHADDAYLIFTDDRVNCAFRLYDGNVRYYFDNPKDYVYLIEEERVIPKKMAGSVPKQLKRRAKAEECFSLAPAGDPSSASTLEMYRKMLSHAMSHISG